MTQHDRPTSKHAIRVAVERQLGKPLTDKQWKILVDAGDVGALMHGVGTIRQLVRQVQTMQEAFGGAPVTNKGARPAVRPRGEVGPIHTGDQQYLFTRQDALCLAVAAFAAQDPEVVAFRREVLEDRHPTYALDSTREGIGEWFSRQIERERPQVEAFTGDPPLLTYIEFIGHGVETTPVAPGGILDRLRVLGERLAARYRWQPPAAIAFVLSGDVIPTIEVLTATVQPNHDVPALTRITLIVDPVATPAAVARAYREARNRITPVRAREMQPKSLFLAAFATERPPREPIKQQMAAWNAAAPDPTWHYVPEQAANFVRDRNAALRRLMRPDYQLPAREETITRDDASLASDSGNEDDKDDNDASDGTAR